MILPRIIALVTVPLYVGHIGAARYGVLSIVWLLLGYFGFLDFGLSRATANALARLTHASSDERTGVFMSSVYFNLLLGVLGGGIIYLIGSLVFDYFLTLSDNLKAELHGALPWVACILPLSLLGGVSRGAIQSHERFLALNVLDMTGSILGQVVPLLCAIFISPTLNVVVPATFVTSAIAVGMTFWFVAKTDTIIGFQLSAWQRLRELFHFGAWVTVTNLVSPIMMSLDQLLVGSTLGAAAVALYAVPMNLVTRSQVIAVSLATVLFPRFSRQNSAEATELGERMAVSLGYLYGALCAPAIVIGGPFMIFWMGPDFAAPSTPVLRLLIMGIWANGVAFIPYSLLEGQRRPDLVAKLLVFELVPFVFTLWLLLHYYGLSGAAVAWVTRVVIDALLLLRVAHFDMQYLARLLPAVILLCVSYGVAGFADVSIVSSLVTSGLIFVSFLGCALAFDPTSRQLVGVLRNRFVEATGW